MRFRKQLADVHTGGVIMKGYCVESGYMGLVEGRYVLFASEEDYLEYIND
jgi:hypothetical protein